MKMSYTSRKFLYFGMCRRIFTKVVPSLFDIRPHFETFYLNENMLQSDKRSIYDAIFIQQAYQADDSPKTIDEYHNSV